MVPTIDYESLLTSRDLLADSSAVLTTAWGEFGCRTELFILVSNPTHSGLRMLYMPSRDFRCDIPESGGRGGRRISDTLERLLEKTRGANARAFSAISRISEGVRATRYIAGVLV